MRLIQFETATGERRVGVVEGEYALEVRGAGSTRELALQAIAAGRDLASEVQAAGLGERHDYLALLAEGRVLPPLDHPDPAHCLVTGTGLTHLGSAATRDKMHQQQAEGAVTDSMRMFQWGLDGGRPPAGEEGAQPEWFYKGDGGIVVRPGADLPLPAFAEDAGEEPFLSGEQNMCHSFENLEFHHFKYPQFLRAGDIHVHYFGTATLSFADGIQARPGDTFEVSLDAFGQPLRNGIAAAPAQVRPGVVKSL